MRVVLLMGGSSKERDVSLATGAGILRALSANGHEVTAVDPATGDRILPGAVARIAESPGQASPLAADAEERSLTLAGNPELAEADAVFIALHGGIGEDGTLQALLDLAGVPYTGSGMLASALAMDKARAKMIFRAAKIPTPRSRLLRTRDDSWDAKSVGGYPLVVKPNSEGSSVGVHIVEKPEELEAALDDAFQYAPVLVEQFIPGRELTVAVVGGKALPVVEIRTDDGFYDYRHKYTKGHTNYQVPAEVSETVATEAARLGELAFASLGCSGVARVDFRLDPEDQLFCLEVNTIPGMTETSLVPMAAQAAGVSYEELVERLLILTVSDGD